MDQTTQLIQTNGHGRLHTPARSIQLACVGAASLALDQIESLFNRLVERGELVQQQGSLRSSRFLPRLWNPFHTQVETITHRQVDLDEAGKPVNVNNYNQVKVTFVIFGKLDERGKEAEK